MPSPRAFPLLALALLAGCGTSEQAKARAERFESKATERAQQLGARLGEGVDKALQRDTYTVKVAPDLAKKGLQVSRADRIKDGRLKAGAKGVTFYAIFDERLAANAELRVLDREGREVGRAYLRLQGPKGSAKWINAPLDPHTPMEAIETVELR
ncbi:MAG: hypothetical protein IPL96_03295 [Holophagaceae bacterium]|nr:hypothetical protein [Holophagaceae bacterium]